MITSVQSTLAPLLESVMRVYEERDPAAASLYLARELRADLRRAEEQVADMLPALTPTDFIRMCNGDRAIQAEVKRFRDARWSLVDVSALAKEEDDTGDPSWTILRGSSRFEVREVDGATAEVNGVDPDEVFYVAWDTEDDTLAQPYAINDAGGSADYDKTDEREARDVVDALNIEDYRQNAAGWPFAWNYAAAIDEREADDFAAAGFVVATHEPSGQVYAGIDGGGYSFMDAHWVPLYLRFLLHGPYAPPSIYMPTDAGLRRVVRGE